jgi:hypothetical protein
MNELRKLSIRDGTVRLDTAIVRSQETHDATVVLGYFDKRICSKKNLDSFVSALPIPFDDNGSDFRHLRPRLKL